MIKMSTLTMLTKFLHAWTTIISTCLWGSITPPSPSCFFSFFFYFLSQQSIYGSRQIKIQSVFGGSLTWLSVFFFELSCSLVKLPLLIKAQVFPTVCLVIIIYLTLFLQQIRDGQIMQSRRIMTINHVFLLLKNLG